MRFPIIAAFSAALAVPAASQDMLRYAFESPCTTEVINLASGASAISSNGLLETNSASSAWTAGRFGNALAGTTGGTVYNRVRTGWNPGTTPVTGDMTMAFFMRQNAAATPPGTSLVYLMGAPSGGVRLFTGGIAGTGLYQRQILATGGNPGVDFALPGSTTDVQALAAAGWVHIAMVVDGTAATADWYVNGTSVLQLTGVTGGASITAAGPFTLGFYSSASRYDIDEFVLSTRAYTAAEIAVLATSPIAGDGDYDSDIAAQCGTLGLSSTGGAPTVGNTNYALVVSPTTNGFFAVLHGFDRCMYAGTTPLPLDAAALTSSAAGCWLLTDIATATTGTTSGGSVTVPFGIPANPAFAGIKIYNQAAHVDFSTNAVSASNGFAVRVGY